MITFVYIIEHGKGVFKMAKKINKIQIFRHLIQVILFFLLPGLYIMAFSELKSVYQMILKGNFNFIQAFPSLIEFIIVIAMTIIMGRFFCGWLCAFGAFNDLVHEMSKNILKINFKVNEKLDSTLKYVKYIVLLFLVIFIWTSRSTLLQGSSPWDAFAQITDITQVFSDLIIGFILLFLITVGAVFIERFFCRYLCPLGAVFTIFSKLGVFKINKPKDKCGACRVCTNNCSMGLPLYKVNSAKGGECINCLKCVEACPRKNANANVMGEDLNPALA
jgi:polyferredoxin